MEKIKDIVKENKKVLIGAGVASLLMGAGYYFSIPKRKFIKNCEPIFFKWKYDKHFSQENISLYKDEAVRRSELMSNVKYDLFLSLRKKEGFRGKLIVTFDLNSTDFEQDELFLDFQGQAIADFEVNGELYD
jgi:hypothetical protein